jgi:predicted enzyme related to lactoylglutathione lyase
VADSSVNRARWVDLASSDAAASRDFYGRLFGWEIEVDEDPQYGGYAIASYGGGQVAGIGPKMSPETPTVWSLYIGSADAEAAGRAVEAAGGSVVMPAFAVGDQGRMAVFTDPSGAFISVWESEGMGAFVAYGENQYGWAELNARGLQKDLPFYKAVFGWGAEDLPMPEGQPDYTQFKVGDDAIAGAMEMSPMIPAEVPSYWMVYFNVADVDDAFTRALGLGATEMVSPMDFPGGRFAIVSDPQGAMFGLLKTNPR